MAEKVIYPQLSGLNWPSNVLHVWLALQSIGVPEYQIRFLPEIAHFAAPEVLEEDIRNDPYPDHEQRSLRHPEGPIYLRPIGGVQVGEPLKYEAHYLDPETVFPRLTVNIRAEERYRFWQNAEGAVIGSQEQIVGRLAHFMDPLMAGLSGRNWRKGESDLLPNEKPVEMLIRQIAERYPELMAVIPQEARQVLLLMGDSLLKAFTTADPERRSLALQAAASVPGQLTDLNACRNAFDTAADKLLLNSIEDLPPGQHREARTLFLRWGSVLFRDDVTERFRALESLTARFESEGVLPMQDSVWRVFLQAVEMEIPFERLRIIRELVEIMTTQAFSAVAALDALWGMGWIHGRISAIRMPFTPMHRDGWLLTMLGGLDHNTVLQILMRRWAEKDEFMGIGHVERLAYGEPATGRARLDMDVLHESEMQELWALVAWRRVIGDPLMLLQTAARRFIHPETKVELFRYTPAVSAFGTLFMQPGKTAVLGAKAKMQFPRVVISLPMVEDEDEQALRAKSVLDILIRLFLPVVFRLEIVWEEGIARLGRASYLQHDFQKGVRLADPWAAMNDTVDADNFDEAILS